MEERKGSIIQLSFRLLDNIKRVFSDPVDFKQKGGYHEVVKTEDEYKSLPNYNSINIVDTKLLKDQPKNSTEIPKHSSLTDSIQEKITELKNIFMINKEENKEEDKTSNKNNQNNNTWKPM